MGQVNLDVLRTLREQAKLTQEEVANKLGYKSSLGYHYIETGRCKLKAEQAIILAKLYGVSLETFFECKNTKSQAS